jgi:hypothetical protein
MNGEYVKVSLIQKSGKVTKMSINENDLSILTDGFL